MRKRVLFGLDLFMGAVFTASMVTILRGGATLRLGPYELIELHDLKKTFLWFIFYLVARSLFSAMGKREFLMQRAHGLIEVFALLYIFLIPFSRLPSHLGVSLAMNFSFGLFLAMGFLYVLLSKQRKVLSTPLFLPLVFFCSICFLSSLLSVDRALSMEAVREEMVPQLGVFLVLLNFFHQEQRVKRVVLCLVIGLLLVVLIGYWGYFTHTLVRDERLISVLKYHNRMGKFLILTLPMAACLFFGTGMGFGKVIYGSITGLGLGALVLTMSRSSWVSIATSFVLVGFMVNKKVFLYVLIGALLIPLILPQRLLSHGKSIFDFTHYFSPKEPILFERPFAWQSALRMIGDHPLLGSGYGRKIYKTQYRAHSLAYKVEAAPVELYTHAHNVFLQVAVEVGLVGLLAFLALFATTFYWALRASFTLSDAFERLVARGIFITLVSIFIHGMVDHFYYEEAALLLWVHIGLLFAMVKGEEAFLKKGFLPSQKETMADVGATLAVAQNKGQVQDLPLQTDCGGKPGPPGGGGWGAEPPKD